MGKKGLLLLIFFTFPGAVFGQSFYENWFPTRSVTFETFSPLFKKAPHVKGSEAYFDISWPINNQIRFVGDMPFIHIHSNPIDSIGSVWSYGNPYIGVEIRQPLHLFYWSFGIRLPLSPKIMPDSSYVPHFSDIERWSAIDSRMGSVQSLLHFHYENESGFAIRLSAGPQFGYSSYHHIFQTLIKYAGQLRLKLYPLIIGGGLEGVFRAKRPYRNVLEYYLSTSFRFGSTEPGIVVLFPSDTKSKNLIRYTIGLRLRFYFDNV